MKDIKINENGITITKDNGNLVNVTPDDVYAPYEEIHSDSTWIIKHRPKTNLDRIRSLSSTDLAPLLIQTRAEEDIDYDWDEEPFVRGIVEYYETSDGDSFSIYEEALEREIWWLNQNYKENTNGNE